ncbi:DNA-directed RNA polymerase subunit beta [Humidisolicoccus flavus]|uniref:DNA-directed RNA polymerase subunit beta n=1 Tax=Humidisolicoccus flavus TaxID=3111414 RepID=UPI003256816F
MSDHHRPARYATEWFDQFQGGTDPVERVRLASDTAAALLSRVRADADPQVVERVLTLAKHDGIDTVTELWADAVPHSLPGALWRLHLIRALVEQRPDECALYYREGRARIDGIDVVVAGAAEPTGPDEVRAVAEEILRGAFIGDFALALDRAASFCRLTARGAAHHADEHDALSAELAEELTLRASRLAIIGNDLTACAALWRDEALH